MTLSGVKNDDGTVEVPATVTFASPVDFRFRLGQQVWYVLFDGDPERFRAKQKVGPDWTPYDRSKIRYAHAKIADMGKQGVKMILDGYSLTGLPRVERRRIRKGVYSVEYREAYREDELYESEEEVRAACEWFPVVLPKQTWKAALGNRKDGSYRDAELAPCCSNISHARDLLYKCARRRGLIQRDRLKLQSLLNDSHPEMLDYDYLAKEGLTNLNLVFSALGLLYGNEGSRG